MAGNNEQGQYKILIFQRVTGVIRMAAPKAAEKNRRLSKNGDCCTQMERR